MKYKNDSVILSNVKVKQVAYSNALISVSSSHEDADLRVVLVLSASIYQIVGIDNIMATI